MAKSSLHSGMSCGMSLTILSGEQVQNFTPIGVTVAKISVHGQIERYKELQQT